MSSSNDTMRARESEEMHVIKRDGTHEMVLFDKILTRLKKLGKEASIDNLNYTSLVMKVIAQLYGGITTSQIDELLAEQCASMASTHPDFDVLAGRVVVSGHQKNTCPSFYGAMHALHAYRDKRDLLAPLVSDELLWFVDKIGETEVDTWCDYSKDYLIDYFGFKTLERAYLMRINGKIVERPQHMWLRVAIGIHGPTKDQIETPNALSPVILANMVDAVRETYQLMSSKKFTHATPTLFNAGTPHPQLSSCFLQALESDSIEGIYNTLSECALISKWAGGIGLHISNLRATGSHIRGTNGVSNGIVPMLRVFNNTARYVDQGGGKRNGSFAIYLEPWHADVEVFLQMRKNHGDEEMKARDLFYALWIPDLFMQRVKDGGSWTLFCPDECPGLCDVYGEEFNALYAKYEASGKGRKTMQARTLWFQVLDAQMETGTPYLCYKDAANRKSNQQNVGIIKSSNLCVAPETLILTDQGQFPIKDLCGKNVRVWNGEEFSEVVVHQTGQDQELMEVHTSDGCILECTSNHSFHVNAKTDAEILGHSESQPENDNPDDDDDNMSETDCKVKCTYVLPAKMLRVGDTLVSCSSWPPLSELADPKHEMDLGSYGKGFASIDVCDPESVPINNNTVVDIDRMSWFAGLCASAGRFERSGDCDVMQLVVMAPNYAFLKAVKFMLQTCGFNAHVTHVSTCTDETTSTESGILRLFYSDVLNLWAYYPYFHKRNGLILPIDVRESKTVHDTSIRITSIVQSSRIADTYCFTEPNRHMGVFGGLLTGQCSEIIEYSDKNETAVCNLASIALPAFVSASPVADIDYAALHAVTKIVTRNLNKIIDRNFYPTEKTRNSNLRHRPIGIGIQGLADVFLMLGVPFNSNIARDVNRRIFETIYHGALEASVDLSEVDGPYSTFAGSPASKGVLQFDMWGLDADHPVESSGNMYDWPAMKSRIREKGLRNSLLLSPMPTASTSQILGYNECIEPITSNIYSRRTIAGEFIIANKYLMKELLSLGMWSSEVKNNIIANHGSIQHITSIPEHVRDKYRTVWELPMRDLIDMAADRGAFICQSQSLNLWQEDPNYSSLTSMHFYAWTKGLKTGIYYLRRRGKHQAQQFTIEPEKATTALLDELADVSFVPASSVAKGALSSGPGQETCEMCSS